MHFEGPSRPGSQTSKVLNTNDERMPTSVVDAACFRDETASMEKPFTTWICLLCGFIYDEAAGLPAEGFSPGTRWSDIPDSWSCPECGYAKSDFEMVEFN